MTTAEHHTAGTDRSRRRPLREVVAQWRDWPLPVKLTAVIAVPVLFAVALGVLQIQAQQSRAREYERIDRIVAVGDQLRGLITAVQSERAAVTEALLAKDRTGPQANGVDTAAAATAQAVRRIPDPGLADVPEARYRDVVNRLQELPAVRERMRVASVNAASVASSYSNLTFAVLAFDRALVGDLADPSLSRMATALHLVTSMEEEVSFQETVGRAGIARGRLLPEEAEALRGSTIRMDGYLIYFHSVADTAQQEFYERTVAGPSAQRRTELLRLALAAPTQPPAPKENATPLAPLAADWATSFGDTTERMNQVRSQIADELRVISAGLLDSSSDMAGIAAVVLLSTLLAAAAVVVVIARQLLRSLRVLRRSALEVAEYQLPDAVARIRDDGAVDSDIEPVPVTTRDEVGQVARAFDAVHHQALHLAAEQAGLRASYASVFVNLSRRGQTLVERQLSLLEQLERDEDDPDQLAVLFKLDHLATRMRRNNENLMVLSGTELARRFSQPVPLPDLLRAAISEIENYQRVAVQPLPPVDVLGYAANDLIRLLAELLDNATAFSAPNTKATISSHRRSDGALVIEVLDQGIGMSDQELAAANARLAGIGTTDAAASRRMGLFVVGRLASRHDVEVELHGGQDMGGVRATVIVPADRIVASTGKTPAPPAGLASQATAVSNATALAKGTALPSGSDLPDGTGLPSRIPGQAMTNGSPAPVPVSGLFTQGRLAVEDEQPSVPPADAMSLEPPAPTADLLAPASPEVTPIFDEMTSSWFDDTSNPEPGAAPAPADPWRSTADEGWQAARAVSEMEPEGFTSAGLPRRTPKARLVPGSATAESGPTRQPEALTRSAGPRTTGIPRDAATIRGWLSGLQSGLHDARQQIDSHPQCDAVPRQADEAGKWRGPADEGWQAARAVSEMEPEGFTSAGLPRRTPKARLVPGSVASAAPSNPIRSTTQGKHEAEHLRDRLGGLQRGLHEGRHALRRELDRVTPDHIGNGNEGEN